MATEYNNNQQQGLRSELEEPRRTTEGQDFEGYKGGSEEEARRTTEGQDFGGYKGVSEEEPPHHKIHTDDEPLPKPAPGAYDEEERGEENRDVMPRPGVAAGEGAPRSTEQYQEYRDTTQDRTNLEDRPIESQPRTEEGRHGGYADPSEAFAGAPVERKVEEPGYGYDQKTSEPVTMETSPRSETGTPKKEGLMAKIKDKLPGHHAKPADSAVEHHDTTATEHEGAPKKGLMAKIKEKMPGHHSPTGTTGTTATE